MWRALSVWLLLMLAESVHGTLRELLLAPRLGDALARRVSVFTGAALIFIIALATIKWIGARRRRDLLTIGALWVVLTVAFEIALGRWVMHLEWSRIAADYDIPHGGLMMLGLVSMFFTPLLAAGYRGFLPDV